MTTTETSAERPAVPSPPVPDHVLSAIVRAVSSIRYGTVTVIVQDGHVVQIDRTERQRLKS